MEVSNTFPIELSGKPLLAAVIAVATPSPTPSAPPVIATVRVATGSAQTLHALPLAASVLDRRRISDSGATTGDALSSMLPGFDRNRSNSAFTNYGQLRVSFDGAGSDRGLVLADGVPAQDGFGGQIDWAAYPAADIVRAELLRGPGSALYGAGAVAGVLSLDTLSPPQSQTPSSSAFSIGAGSHAFERFYAEDAAPLSQRFTVSAFAEYDGLRYRDLPPDYSSPIDEAAQSDQSTTALRFAYAASSASTLSYEVRGAWDAQAEGRPNYSFARRLLQQDLHYLFSGRHSSLEFVPYVRAAFITNLADQFPSAPGVLRYTQYVPSDEAGATLHWSLGGGFSKLDVVADAKFVHGESEQYGATGEFQSLGSGVQHLGGAGIQETITGPRWELVAGIHADTENFFDGELVSVSHGRYLTSRPPGRSSRALSPRAAFRYDLTRTLALRVADGGGLRLPYLNELVRSYRIGAVSYAANPNLLPERSASFTAGLDWLNGPQHASVDVFDTSVADAIMFRTIAPVLQMYENVNRTRSTGVTLDYDYALADWLRFTLSGTSQDARVVSGDAAIVGKRLAYVPDGYAALGVSGNTGAIAFGATLSFLGQTYADDLNTEPLGRAVVAGLHAAFPIAPRESLVLDASNLTGAHYLSSIDRYAPPAIVSLSVMAR
jgi:outer membrane receptor protein involved in Fe transport